MKEETPTVLAVVHLFEVSYARLHSSFSSIVTKCICVTDEAQHEETGTIQSGSADSVRKIARSLNGK
jgi:hypothetical protein